MSSSISTITSAQYGAFGYAPTPDAISASEFALWPEAMQVGLVRAYGSGTPPTILLGGGSTKAFATLMPGNGTVDLTPAPTRLDAAPGDLAVAEFLSWPTIAQIFYLETSDQAGLGTLDVGPASGSIRVAIARDASGAATGVDVTASSALLGSDAALFSVEPSTLPLASFFGLSADEQFAYASRWSSATPPTVTLAGGAGGTVVALTSNGRSYGAVVPATAFNGYTTPLAGQASAVTGFDTWPSSVRDAYLEARLAGTTYPKVAVFVDAIWSLAGRGAEAERYAIPVGFATAPDTLAAADFVRWPQPVQIAYARAALAGAATGSVTIGSAPAVTATLSNARPVLGLSSAADLNADPSALSLDLFQLWPAADQDAYLDAKGSGSPKSITLAASAGRPAALVLRDGDGRVTTALLPSGFSTPPSSLSPTVFLNWPAAVRELYATSQLSASPVDLAPTTFLGWQPFFRERYVATHLENGATSITIGPASTGSGVTVTPGRTGLAYAPAGTFDLSVFNALPDADRLSYLNANGTGTPKTIDVAQTTGSQTVVSGNIVTGTSFVVPRTLIYQGQDGTVAATAFPSDYPAAGSAATVASASAFLAWAPIFQSVYATGHLTSGQSYATIGTGGTSVLATPAGGVATITTTAANFNLTLFQLWPAADRLAYFNANGTGVPKAIDTLASTVQARALVQVASDGTVTSTALPSGYASGPSALSATAFLGWSASLQQRYVTERLTPPATTLTIGAGMATILATATSNGIAISTTPAAFNLTLFRMWPVADRLAYFDANGTGVPKAIDTLASTVQARLLVRVAANGVVASDAYPVTGRLSSRRDCSEEEFKKWPLAAQVAYVRDYGIGTPAAVAIDHTVVRLSSGGNDVEIIESRLDFDRLPRDIDTLEFVSWPEAAQVFYVENYAAGGTRVDVGRPDRSLAVSLQRDSAGRAVGVQFAASAGFETDTASFIADPPQNVAASRFFDLTPEEQYAYAARNSTATPPSVVLRGATSSNGLSITVSHGSTTYVVTVPSSTYPGFSTALTSLDSGVSSSTFSDWPRPVQTAYIEARYPTASTIGSPYPKVLVFDDGRSVGMVRSAGDDAEVVAGSRDLLTDAAALSTAASVSAATFVGWPQAAQIAYVRTFMSAANEADGGDTRYDPVAAALFGPTGSTYSVALSRQEPFVSLSSASGQSSPPASLDLTLFQLWSTDAKDAYLTQKGAGTPKLLTIPQNGDNPRVLLYAGSDGHARLSVYPRAFDLAPTSLSLTDFQTWPAALQRLYIQNNGGGNIVVTGPAGSPVRVAVDSGGQLFVQTNLNAPYIVSSPGMFQPIPYQNLIGSDVGNSGEPNRTAAETLFPTLDGTDGHTLPIPAAMAADFAKTQPEMTVAIFNSWSTVYQLQWLRREMGTTATSVTIGPTDGQQETAFISSSGTKVYIAENLTKQDIAKMPLADQTRVAGLTVWTTIAANLGLDGGTTARVQMQALVDRALAMIAAPQSTDSTLPTYSKIGDGQVPQADKDVFNTQLNNLKASFATMSVFSKADIEKAISDITDRFDRVNAFSMNLNVSGKTDPSGYGTIRVTTADGSYNQPTALFNMNLDDVDKAYVEINGQKYTLYQYFTNKLAENNVSIDTSSYKINNPSETFVFTASANEPSDGYSYVPASYGLNYAQLSIAQPTRQIVSTDHNTKIQQGYDVFMAQEKQLLNLSNARKNLANNLDATGQPLARNLDVPNLVYLFQLYANLAGEAKIRIASEEVDQTNALLKTYSLMQNIVNRVLGIFTGTDTTATKSISNIGSLTLEEQLVVKMFNASGSNSLAKHPIEALFNITRPTLSSLTSAKQSSAWQQYSTSIGDKVTLINQESQIKMNEINSMTKQKDRNFDLANNALTKMAEVIQKIASLN